MARTKRKALDTSTAELTDTVREFTPAKFDQPDTSFDLATLERQQTAAEVVGQVADHYAMPPDTVQTHADRHPPRERVIQSGLTFHRSDLLAGVKQGEGFRLQYGVKVREVVMAFDEKPSREVITAMHDAGFTWRSADKLWTYTIGNQTAAQDRLHGERTFEQVAKMIRQEKGVGHSFGG